MKLLGGGGSAPGHLPSGEAGLPGPRGESSRGAKPHCPKGGGEKKERGRGLQDGSWAWCGPGEGWKGIYTIMTIINV